MNESKIAIFVSGPVRFVDLVRQNLDQRLAGVDHDFFYHLWGQDLGNKVRMGYQSDPIALLAQSNTKTLLVQQPYAASFYEHSIGSQVNTHSTVNSVIGMFLGIAQLCQVFKTLPDRSAYTHILRIRTDCAITDSHFLEQLVMDPSTVTLSRDSGLPSDGWVSDHLLFAPADLFLRIYDMDRIESLYAAFEQGRRNPEKILKHLLDTRLPAGTRGVEKIERYRHYQIVYSPPRTTDQAWLRALIEQGRVPEIFLEPEKHRRCDEDEATLLQSAAIAPRKDPFRNPFWNLLRRLKRKFIG